MLANCPGKPGQFALYINLWYFIKRVKLYWELDMNIARRVRSMRSVWRDLRKIGPRDSYTKEDRKYVRWETAELLVLSFLGAGLAFFVPPSVKTPV